MDSISCGVRRCAHNMAGACDAGIVFMSDDMCGGALCGTFTYAAEPENATAPLSARGMRTPAAHGYIACAVKNCVHNSAGLCAAATVCVSDREGAAICIDRENKNNTGA